MKQEEYRTKNCVTNEEVIEALTWLKEQSDRNASVVINGEVVTKRFGVGEIIYRLHMANLGIPQEEFKNYAQIAESIAYTEAQRSEISKIDRYWIERAKSVIIEEKREEWEKCCYAIFSNPYEYPLENRALKNAIKIILVLGEYTSRVMEPTKIYKVLDEVFTRGDEYKYQDSKNEFYDFINEIICKFSPQYSVFQELTFHNKIIESKEGRMERKIVEQCKKRGLIKN